MKKCALGLFLALVTVLSLCSGVFAADGNTFEVNGTTFRYALENGTLTVSGSGRMSDDCGGNIDGGIGRGHGGIGHTHDYPWDEASVFDIVLGEGIGSVCEGFFAAHPSVCTVRLPASLEYFQLENASDAAGVAAVFAGCANLTAVYFSEDNSLWASDSGLILSKDRETLLCVPCGLSGTVYVPDGVVTVAGNALACVGGCVPKMTGLWLPASVTTVCDNQWTMSQFQHLADLTYYMAAGGSAAFSAVDGVLYSADGRTLIAYPRGRTGPFTVPAGVTAIWHNAFAYNTQLKQITLSEGLAAIGSGAFSASGITSITVPGSVTSIGEEGRDDNGVYTTLGGRFGDGQAAFPTVYGYSGSAAESFVQECQAAHGGVPTYTFVALDGVPATPAPEASATPAPVVPETPAPDIPVTPEPTPVPTPVPTPAPVPPAEHPSTGWAQNDAGTWYYFKKDAMVTGWQKVGKTWYYMDPATGAMATGWVNDGGTYYYMKDSGAMVTGWKQVDGVWYYFASSGAMKTGWLKDGKTWYYLNADGKMATGWVNDGGTWYYLKSSGAMATGWAQVDGDWYYFGGSGAMKTGWLRDGKTWYYLDADGKMATGWVNDGGTYYYMKDSGAMVTGWRQVDGTWYYFTSSGAMKTGWLKDGKTWYYLDADGKMLADTSIVDKGVEYFFNASGACINP